MKELRFLMQVVSFQRSLLKTGFTASRYNQLFQLVIDSKVSMCLQFSKGYKPNRNNKKCSGPIQQIAFLNWFIKNMKFFHLN